MPRRLHLRDESKQDLSRLINRLHFNETPFLFNLAERDAMMLPLCLHRKLSLCPVRMFIGTLTMVLLSAVGITPASAQDSRPITFSEAVRIALDRNVSIHRARNNVELQATNVSAQKAKFLPILSLNSGSSRFYGLSFDQTAGKLVQETSQGFNIGAGSSVSIFSGFANVASLAQARKRLESQGYQYDRTKQDIVFEVIWNYWLVIQNNEQVRIQEENLNAARVLLSQIEDKIRVGAIPNADLYNQQVTVAESESNLLSSETALLGSKTELAQTLQLDPLGDYEFEIPDVNEIPLTAREFNTNALLGAAFDNRDDLKAREASIEAASYGIRVARAGYYPRISFSSSIGTSYSDQRGTFIDGSFIQTPFGDQLTDNRSGSLRLSISYSLFDGMTTKNAVETNRVQYNNSLLDLDEMQQSVAFDIRQAYSEYQASVKQLEVTQVQLRAAEQAREVEEIRYNIGAITLDVLADARSRYVNASSRRVQAIFEFHIRQRLLDYYQGTLDPSQPLF